MELEDRNTFHPLFILRRGAHFRSHFPSSRQNTRPLAIDPLGKFLFGFNSTEVATVQIGAAGKLSKISSVPRSDAVDVYIHPSGSFLYVQSFPFIYQYDLHVYKISSAGTLTSVASETNFTPDQSFRFTAFNTSGKFVFSNRCGGPNPCQLDTLSVDQTTGYINPKPMFS